MFKYCFVILVAAPGFLCSCTSPRYIYSPSPANNPYFKEKGDSKLATYYSSGFDENSRLGNLNRGVDVQGAYAVSNNIAVTAGYHQRRERDVYMNYRINYFDSSILQYKRHITDIGVGFFEFLDRRKTFSVNLYGGIGIGKFSFTDRGIDKSRVDYSRFHNSSITKFYFQPSLNCIAGDYFRAGFIGKLSFVHYGNITTSYTNDEIQYFLLNKINNKTISFFEPSFNIQFGIPPVDWVKVDGSFTFSSDPFADISRLQARSFMTSIGLSFDFFKINK